MGFAGMACWELRKPSANAVRPHLALVILSRSQEFSMHVDFGACLFWRNSFGLLQGPSGAGSIKRPPRPCKVSFKLQISKFRPRYASVVPLPKNISSFSNGPNQRDFCWRGNRWMKRCQAAGGCGKGQTFRHILPTVTLVVASQNCNSFDFLRPFGGCFLTVLRFFDTNFTPKKKHDESRSAFYSVVYTPTPPASH